MRLEDLVRDNVKNMTPYRSARDEFWGRDYVLLDANENPFDTNINRYPDPYQRALKSKISEIKGIPSENVFIGNGSDEIIDLLFRCFCKPGVSTACSITPSYGMYKVSAAVNDVDMHFCSLDTDFSLPVSGLINGFRETDKLLFLCNPNNPTGNEFDQNDILKILEEFNGIVVVDEAYIDFAKTESLLSKVDQYGNLVVMQTLSKAWGAAGLRLGIGFMNPEIITYLNKIKPPYNIGSLSQNRAVSLLKTSERYQDEIEQIRQQREYLYGALSECISVLKVFPSEANFLLVKFKNPKKTHRLLRNEGIVVRDRSNQPLCEGCLRITVGKKEENERMILVLHRLGEQ